jgi:hypothetical protein
MFAVFPEDGPDRKEAVVGEIANKTQELISLLEPKDVPPWLNALYGGVTTPRANFTREQLLKHIIQILNDIYNFTWELTGEEDGPIEFDELFTRLRSETKIDKLFDDAISKLQEILDTGQIEYVKAIKALEHLIATLKKSKGGSYLAMIAGWDFLQSFLRNLAIEEVKAIPIIGPIISALIATAEEGRAEILRLEKSMAKELTTKYAFTPQSLTYTNTKTLGFNPIHNLDIKG